MPDPSYPNRIYDMWYEVTVAAGPLSELMRTLFLSLAV